jgi:hypothetical protein
VVLGLFYFFYLAQISISDRVSDINPKS